MKSVRKLIVLFSFAALALSGSFVACSDSDCSCGDSEGSSDSTCQCKECSGKEDCKCPENGSSSCPEKEQCSCPENPGNTGCKGDDEDHDEPGSEIVDDGKFDINGARLLSENIVKYYSPGEGQLQPTRSVTMLDFTTKEFKPYTSTEQTRNYSRAYKFEYSKEYARIYIPSDISAYSVLTMPIYVPESAVGQSLYIQFTSENSKSTGEDYYSHLIEFKKAGWNDFEIELDKMRVTREPLGMDHLGELILETREDKNNKPETTIYIENLILRTDPAKVAKEDKVTTLVDFSDSKYAKNASSEQVKIGTTSYKWEYTKSMFDVDVPNDLSGNEAISLWVYVPEESVGQSFYMQFLSQDGDRTNGDEYYGYLVKLNYSGWNKYVIRLKDCEVNRTPQGWNKIDYILLTRQGFSQDSYNKESTVIYLSNIEGHTKIEDSKENAIPQLDGAAFSIHGSRAIVDNVLIKNSYSNEKSTVYKEKNEYWLPLSVFGARYDEDAVYQPKTHSLQMKIDGKVYQFKGGKNTVNIDGTDTALDFTVAVKGDSLFAPVHYIKSLMGYTEEYIDEMEMIYLSKKPYSFDALLGRLNIMFETLFVRPNGIEIAERINKHWGGDVHPRIMLTQRDFDRLKAMIGEDETYTSYVDYLIRRYGTESGEFKEDPVIYRLPDGVRLLEISRKARNRIIPWALLYKLTGQVAYVNRVWREVEALINFKDWHPEHYLDTAEILYPMAIAFDWLYDAWEPWQRDQMAEAVVKFGLNTGLDRYEGRVRKWENINWNGVCNGGLSVAALAYLNHPTAKDAAQRVLNYSIRDVELGMDTYAPDGGYLESTGYWAYGTDYVHVMISALKAATGTDFGLYHSPGLAHSAYFTTFFENDAGAWGFHDAKPDQSDTWTHYWFARESKDSSLGRLRHDAISSKLKGIHFYDGMYYSPELVGELPNLSLDAYYSAIETLTMRDAWTAGSTLTGIHAGYNAQPHGDRDIGNFVIFGAGKQFITDLGSEDYDLPNYALRYRKSAEGQNTLVIGDFDASKPAQVPDARAKIVRHKFGKDSAYAVVDMQPAYSNVSKAERGLLFTDARSTIVVQDEITLPEPQVVRWAAHTIGSIEVAADGRSATISVEGADKILYAEIISADTSLKFESKRAVSYDPDYASKLTNSDKEYNRDAYSKLVIISSEVSAFNTAVAFKFIDKNASKPSSGSIYTWTDIAHWDAK